MKRIVLVIALTLILALVGCSSPPSSPPTQTPTTAPAIPTATTQSTATTAPTNTNQPTAVLPTAISATNTTAPTAAPITQPTATWDGTTDLNIYMIAMEDNGASGPKIGCGDSIIEVRRTVPRTQSPLRVAFETLLAENDEFYGESGFYNPIHHYDLTVDDVNIRADGTAVVRLSGEFFGIGTCEDPRIQAQLEYTALQFDTVKDVEIWINGELLDDLFDMSG